MFVPISNTPRDYAWGSTTAIPELFGVAPDGRPQAELWLGTHPGSPALTADGAPLAEVAGTLPFLLKVLAAASPLSLQAHPTPEQAAAGYDREDAAGVPLDAPERNYKDRGHKPELIVALSERFRALCGFRPTSQTRLTLEGVPGAESLRERLDSDDALRDVVEWLISRGAGVDELVAAVSAHSGDGLEWETVRLLAETYPGDPGIVISLLLHTVELRAGEALYLPAGNIHAYLEGLGIELMAASDNVLRGGQTPKHIDVPELLSVLDFTPILEPRLAPETVAPGVVAFRPDVPDFELLIADGGATATPAGAAIVLVLDAPLVIRSADDAVEVPVGGAVYLPEGGGPLSFEGSGRAFVATTSLTTRP